MNNLDYDSWETYHCDAFPAVRGWLTENPGTRAHWGRALKHTALADAKRATDAVFANQELLSKAGYSAHPSIIRRLASTYASERAKRVQSNKVIVDGQYTYACLKCSDTGVLEVWSSVSVRKCLDGANVGDAGTSYSAAVACTCASGETWRAKQDPLIDYEPETMLLMPAKCPKDDPRPYIEFLARLRSRPVQREVEYS